MHQLTDETYKPVVSLEGVSKCFRRYDHPIDRLKEVLAANRSKGQEFWALNDINLKVYRGRNSRFYWAKWVRKKYGVANYCRDIAADARFRFRARTGFSIIRIRQWLQSRFYRATKCLF